MHKYKTKLNIKDIIITFTGYFHEKYNLLTKYYY